MKRNFVIFLCFYLLSSISSFQNGLLRQRLSKASKLHFKIAFTREYESNINVIEKLKEFECYNLPCIEFINIEENISLLSSQIPEHNCIILTSPQAANVFLSTLPPNSHFEVPIASLGKGTSKILENRGLKPAFEPTDALGETLASEIPKNLGPKILYPCSELASDTISNILKERDFQLTRINTYKPIQPIWDDQKVRLARQMDLVTFASPSAIKYWKSTVGTNITVVAIGPTTKEAALKAGFKSVYSLESSLGLESWVNLIRSTSKMLMGS